jgi:hypothetical protein
MNAKAVQAPSENRDARPRRAQARSEGEPLAQVLERLRDGLLERLERVEALAAEQTAMLDADSSDRERALRERLSVLEAAHARVVAEARRREQEWQEVVQQLQTDRALLAEAWERVEQIQIQYEPRADPVPQPATVAAPGPPQPQVPVVAAVARAPADDGDDPVTRAILRQFQALSQDVRRNSRGKSVR